MDHKIKKIFTNWRVLVAIAFVILAIVAINPVLDPKGVAIRNVVSNSSANIAGITNPTPNTAPTAREKIISVNNKPVNSVDDYYKATSDITYNETVTIRTSKNKEGYILLTKADYETIQLNETEIKTIRELVQKTLENGTNVTEFVYSNITVNKTYQKLLGLQDIGVNVYEAPRTNLVKGLDLEGGTRVILQPETKLSSDDMKTLLDNMKERLNVFGLSDIVVTQASDLTGSQFIVVEIAGANEREVKDLLSKQGKFEAKIGEDVTFRGGNRDITYVCRSADCSGIDPRRGCSSTANGYVCSFYFTITLSPEAASRQAQLTKELSVVTENGNEYLSQDLTLFLDDKQVDKLKIGSELKGSTTTNIQISGSGSGVTQQEAASNALESMKKLQTVLITGSLPVKLSIVKTDQISPQLGKDFLNNSIIIGILTIISVAIIIFIRYRLFSVSIPIMITMLIEIIILLGFAALVRWNLDLAAIAGILVAVGTGVDDQIIIADETISGSLRTEAYDWKRRMKNAFFIIFGSYFAVCAAMFPLIFAGAGLLKGFAFTTIVGVTVGVLISRPAYAAIVEIMNKNG